jgi:hypothetical protein
MKAGNIVGTQRKMYYEWMFFFFPSAAAIFHPCPDSGGEQPWQAAPTLKTRG